VHSNRDLVFRPPANDFEEQSLGQYMNGRRVLIKLGGGLITFKEELCKVRLDILNACAESIANIVDMGWRPIIVHGAGGFGHLRAKQYSLSSGLDENIDGQSDAVEMVRREMLELNSHVCKALINAGLKVSSHPPHTWSRGTGQGLVGSLERFDSDDGIIPVTFGDVNDCDEPQCFGILSGDHLMERLATIEGVSKAIFALFGVDGIMTTPPDSEQQSTLLRVIDSESDFISSHDSNIDVTGGIALKITCAKRMAAAGIDVWMINGAHPERMVDALLKKDTIGTNVIV